MSLLGNDMAPGVRKELCRRAKIIPDGYGPWSHARIPWIRVSPCIHDNQQSSPESLRKKHILFGGSLQDLESTYNTNTSNRLGPQRDTDSGGTRRNTPKAGVKSVSIEEKGTLGGIKKAIVNFTVWSDKDLIKYERHLMTLGKHVLVEWGWNVDSHGSVVRTNLGKSQTSVSLTDSELSCTIRGKQSTEHYCYDAIRGMVSNFNWSINEFGGFDCKVDLISKGTTFLSTPIETATMHSGCDEDPETADTAGDEGKVHRPNIEQPMAFLRQTLADTWDSAEPHKNKNASGNGYIGMAALFDKEIGFMDWLGSFFSSEPTNAELEFYITWDYFEEYIINRKLAPAYALGSSAGKKDTAQSEPGVDKCGNKKSVDNPQSWTTIYNKNAANIDKHPRKSDIPYALDSRGSVLRNSTFLMSADPTKCMLPGQEHWKLHKIRQTGIGNIMAWLGGVADYAKTYVVELVKSISVSLKNGITADYNKAKKKASAAQKDTQKQLQEDLADDNVSKTTDKLMKNFKRFDPKAPGTNGPGSSGEGLISNIMLNLAFIEEVANEAKSLDEFMDQLLQGIQDACGGHWDLVICPDPDNPQIVRVIDQNMKTPSDTVNGFHFDGIGRKSICRDISIETDIDSKMAAVVMYGSNKHQDADVTKSPQPMGGKGSSEYSTWGAGIKDLVMADIGLRDSKGQEPEVDCCNQATGHNGNATDSAWSGYFKSAEELANKVTPDASEGMVTAMRKLLNTANPDQALPTKDGVSVAAFHNEDHTITIPLKVGLTIDGISGIKWGNMFSFTNSTPIPTRYKNFSFQITKVEHEISDDGWKTTLGSVMRPLKCKTYTSCGSNQGKLPTDIVPTTADVVDYEIITVKDIDVDDDQNTDETQDRDSVTAVKMDTIPPGELDTSSDMELAKAKCPCQDGTHHEDCCNSASEGEEGTIPVITQEEVEKTDPDKKGCQCDDGEFREDCCDKNTNDGDGEKDGGDGECKDDIPLEEPGYTENIEEEKNPPEDVVVEDKVEEEDCDDWGPLGETLESGTITYWPRAEIKFEWYYEFRRNQKHCFFVDLYLWSGIDSQTGKPAFTQMYPPSSIPTKNLAGTMNLFSAAMLNRRATVKDVVQITGRKKSTLKASKSYRKNNRLEYKKITGISENQDVDLKPGSNDSPGLWVDTHMQFFREDQPYAAWQGPGGMDVWNKWKDGKGGTNVVSNQKNQGGSVKAMMAGWLKHHVLPMMKQTCRDITKKMIKGAGRSSGGKQYYRPSEIQTLMQDAKTGKVAYGWNQEYFSALKEEDLNDYNDIQYVQGYSNVELENVRNEFKDRPGYIFTSTGIHGDGA